MALKLSNLIDLGTGVTKSLIGRNAAGDAAKTISSGIDASKVTLDDSIARQRGIYQPYVDAGKTGITRLADLATDPRQFGKTFTGPAVNPSALFDKNFKAPTGEEVMNEPGYAFGLSELQKGIERSQNARHGLLGGAAGKELLRYGNDYQSTKYNDAFERKLTEYGLEKDLFQGNEKIKYDQGNDAYKRGLGEFDLERDIFNENADREAGAARDLEQAGAKGVTGLSNAEGRYGDQIADLEAARAAAIAAGDLAKAQELEDLIGSAGDFGADVLDGVGGAVEGVGLDKLGSGIKDVGSAIGSGVKTVGSALGSAGSAVGGALGSAGSAIGTLGGLVPLAAGIPIIGAGLAVAGKLLINSQQHRNADKLTGEGGIQNNLNKDLEQLAISVGNGEISQQEADPQRQQVFKAWADKALQFASESGGNKTVVRQMLTSYDWDPALKALAAEYRARLG